MSEANGIRPPSLRALAAQAETAEALAACLLGERERLRAANLRQPQGQRACRKLSDAADLVILRMLALSLPAEPADRDQVRPKISIVATGGYGRRELCPFSDIDVTFIVAEEEDPLLDATVRRMFMLLMEIFSQRGGLKVGYGYRTPADVAQLDHQTQTALLDLRVVAGSHGLGEQFAREVVRHLWPAAFVRQKLAERAAARAKHGETLYRIEPEVREGPGGLRDLHLAEWLAAVSFPSTRGDVWAQLQRLGAVSRRDVQQVSAARDFLLSVRTWMHWHAGRSADLLVRERQEGAAVALQFQDDAHASHVERFMERYYEHAENTRRVSGFVYERCLNERLSLSDELVCAGGELLPAYPWVSVGSPHFLVEVAQHYQEHGLEPGYELRRMIAQQVESISPLGKDPDAADRFVALFRAVRSPAPAEGDRAPGARPGVHATLRLLADLGVLQRLLPEFGQACRRVPFDQVHRHTVGYHSLETVRSLESLRHTTEEPLQEFRRIWAAIDEPELMYLAALLHDIGKLAAPTQSHSEAGARMARAIGERLHLAAPGLRSVELLVRHHLLMSETAQLRDVTLDRTIQDFTAAIDSMGLLNMLMLLTCADMEATGVLSPMKIRFLEQLYFRAEQVLSGALPAPSVPAEQRFRSRLSRRLSAANLSTEQIREHTEGMPVSYLLNTRPEQIALHIRMVEALRQNGPVVEFDSELGREITTIHLCTLDRPEPGLLSQIAGVLYAHEVSVHGAQVFTRDTRPAIALDTLWADCHGHGIPPLKRLELEQDLVATLKGGDVEALIARCRKQLPPPVLPPEVRINNDLAEDSTVVEIKASNQPALLYRITRAMAALGWNIESARISTRGDVARDAFYVTDRGGGKVEDDDSRLAEAFIEEFRR